MESMIETAPVRKPTGSVVLDIGDGVGALVVYTDASWWGREIEVSRAGCDTQRVHTDVLERRVNGEPVFAAVFASLAEGDYTLWRDEVEPDRQLTIRGGQVAEIDWR
jgi:hypothetical protein